MIEKTKRQMIVEQILDERVRQFDLPGSEHDGGNTPNDWISTIVRLASENNNSRGRIVEATCFEDSLIKCGAVVLAALEHIENMKNKKFFIE